MTDVQVLQIAQCVIATIATICMVGLGFLYRPGRATTLWSLTFILAMATSYTDVVATILGSDTLRRAALGLLLCAPGLIWAGLRAYRGARAHSWIALLAGIAGAIALATLSDTAYPWGVRAAYAVSAVFAALTTLELVRRPERGGGTSFPLSLFSLLFVAVGITTASAGALTTYETDLASLRLVNGFGMLAYITCALVTLLFLARGGAVDASRGVFPEVAAERLRRAQAAGERSWALLYVRVDDAADLRAVRGDAGYAAVLAAVHDDICEAFPTEADIGRVALDAYAVLVAQPPTVLRERVRTLLRTIAAPEPTQDVSVSASVGWAGVAEQGYALDDLLSAARTSASAAAGAGGDRWERAVGRTAGD